MGGVRWRRVLLHACALTMVCLFGGGCLTRPLTNGPPTTKESWSVVQRQGAVDKIDLLFMIDNSASMGDKQELLASAVPDLLSRLLQPLCVVEGSATIVARDAQGRCPPGSKVEFEPVHDMHIGVVSSSLGGGGSTDSCTTLHNDDQAHLLRRAKGTTTPITDAAPDGFLAWLPAVSQNDKAPAPADPRITDDKALVADFSALVSGVQEDGCGLEAQMESWYRFLVQPDPYAAIAVDRTTNVATLQGVDADILTQRRDFLRPDSLLAVIAVTDEEDSWTDPLWLGGSGWVTRARDNGFTTGGQLPRATSACDLDPNDPACTWCGFKGHESDPNCAKGPYGRTEDNLNVRYTNDMKRRYGMNPQFPIERYVTGLKGANVPDRSGEHFTADGKLTSAYLGRANCVNPIYATDLPTSASQNLCALKRGPRTTDLVFFAVIGGVPWQLLTANPSDPSAPFKASLDASDWQRVLGKDPSRLDPTGIDPHMIESIRPRAQIGCGTGASSSCDPIHGREWDTTTSKVELDLQYACTFELPRPKDCSSDSTIGCDCGGTYNGPLCDPQNPKSQVRGKAYPTIRELRVVQAMGDNGVVASICPRTLDTKSDDYGYRPAMRAIVDRLKSQLGGQCLPHPLARGQDGAVSCLLLTIVEGTSDQASACDAQRGLKQPEPSVLARFNAQRVAEGQREAAARGAPFDPSSLPAVCELAQITPDDLASLTFGGKPTCDGDGQRGWCYVEGKAAGTCSAGSAQAIRFGAPPPGPTIIQCIDQSN